MKRNLFTLASVLITVFMMSCQKQDMEVVVDSNEINQTTTDYSNYKSEFKFYLDNKEVEENSLMLKSNDLIIFEKGTMIDSTQTSLVEVFGFTTESLYTEFGEANDYKLAEQLQFEKSIRAYIVSNNIEQYYETNGEVPASYTVYEKNLAEQLFNIDYDSKSIFAQFNQEYDGKGDGTLLSPRSGLFPFLILGWDNKISSFQFCGLYGYVTFYDSKFYKNKMYSTGGMANMWHNVLSLANDKASSFMVWW